MTGRRVVRHVWYASKTPRRFEDLPQKWTIAQQKLTRPSFRTNLALSQHELSNEIATRHLLRVHRREATLSRLSMAERPSSPLSQPDDPATKSPSPSTPKAIIISSDTSPSIQAIDRKPTASSRMFSVASLCSPDNSNVSTPLTVGTSPKPPLHGDQEDLDNGDLTIGAAATSKTTSSLKSSIEGTATPELPDRPSQISSVTASETKPEGEQGDEDDDDETDDGQDGEVDANNIDGGQQDPEDSEDEDDDEEDDDEDEDEDDDEEDDDDDEDDDGDVSTASHEKEGVGVAKESTTKGEPGSATEQAGAASGEQASQPAPEAPNTLVPKKRAKRKQREPSVDVSLPKGPPALPTMRIELNIKKLSLDEYLLDIPEKLNDELKKTGHPWSKWYEQRQKEPVASTSAAAGAGGTPAAPTESLGDLGPFAHLLNKYPVGEPGPGEGKPKKRRKRRKEIEEYDVNDPFVDDSELQIDEPTHAAKPASKGFYVAFGDIELERLQKKKRGAKAIEAAAATASPGAGPSTANGTVIGGASRGGRDAAPSYLIHGTQLEVSNKMFHLRTEEKGSSSTPSIPLEELQAGSIGLSDPSEQAKLGESRDSPIKVDDEPASKKKTYPTKPVNKLLAAEFEHLRRLVAQEDFSVKSKFPPSLRPPLRKAAQVALETGEYNENFFNYLPALFPYNRFTMSKLVKREFFDEHVKLLKGIQDDLYDDLKDAIEEALPANRAEYEETLKKWRETGNANATQGGDDSSNAMAVDGGEGAGDASEGNLNGGGGGGGGEENGSVQVADGGGSAPLRKWRWTERMREDVFQIILLENGITELRVEKNKLENTADVVSELVMRKAAYKRMNDLFPEDEGWTTTTAISKEFSMTKKKHDRQNHAMAEQAAAAAAAQG